MAWMSGGNGNLPCPAHIGAWKYLTPPRQHKVDKNQQT